MSSKANKGPGNVTCKENEKKQACLRKERAQKGVALSVLTWGVEKAAAGGCLCLCTAEEEGEQSELSTGEGWALANQQGGRLLDTSPREPPFTCS